MLTITLWDGEFIGVIYVHRSLESLTKENPSNLTKEPTALLNLFFFSPVKI